MKIKRRWFSGLEYVFVCLASFGLCYVIRVAVSQAIRMTLDDSPETVNKLVESV